MPHGKQKPPGIATIHNGAKLLGVRHSTYSLWVLQGRVQRALGISPSRLDIPEDLLASHADDIVGRLWNPNRAMSASQENTTRVRLARQWAINSRGQWHPVIVQSLRRVRPSMMDPQLRKAYLRHRSAITRRRKAAKRRAWRDRFAGRKRDAIATIREAAVGQVPGWALDAVMYTKNLPLDVVEKRAAHWQEQNRLRAAKKSEPHMRQTIRDYVRVVNTQEPGTYPPKVSRLLNGIPDLDARTKHRLREHLAIMAARERTRMQASNRRVSEARSRARRETAFGFVRSHTPPYPRAVVRTVNMQRRRPQDIRQAMEAHRDLMDSRPPKPRPRRASAPALVSPTPKTSALSQRAGELKAALAELNADLVAVRKGQRGNMGNKYGNLRSYAASNETKLPRDLIALLSESHVERELSQSRLDPTEARILLLRATVLQEMQELGETTRGAGA